MPEGIPGSVLREEPPTQKLETSLQSPLEVRPVMEETDRKSTPEVIRLLGRNDSVSGRSTWVCSVGSGRTLMFYSTGSKISGLIVNFV